MGVGAPRKRSPGTYRAEGKQRSCCWEWTGRSGEILDDRFATSAQEATVTIRGTGWAVHDGGLRLAAEGAVAGTAAAPPADREGAGGVRARCDGGTRGWGDTALGQGLEHRLGEPCEPSEPRVAGQTHDYT